MDGVCSDKRDDENDSKSPWAELGLYVDTLQWQQCVRLVLPSQNHQNGSTEAYASLRDQRTRGEAYGRHDEEASTSDTATLLRNLTVGQQEGRVY